MDSIAHSKNILIINAGSGSVRYKLYAMPEGRVLKKGMAERLETAHSQVLKKLLSRSVKSDTIDAVAHRVVHGGKFYDQAVLVNEEVKQRIEELSPLAPLHNPVQLQCIETAEALCKDIPQFAVFDTAFFRNMPAGSRTFGIGKDIAASLNIEAFGFHGTSHRYISKTVMNIVKKEELRLISLHLGGGCSAAAVRGLQPLDCSMGFTPLGGLMMTTRPGDLDPFIPVYLIKKLGWSVQTLEEYLNHQCGLKGLCGRSDMRDVAEAIKNNDSSAIFARDLFVYRVRKYIGALAAVLGGVDVLSFTGAMAENDALLRAEICREMEWLQIYIDPNRNRQLKEGERGNIAMPGRRNIFVIPSNEELQMAVEIYDRFASML